MPASSLVERESLLPPRLIFSDLQDISMVLRQSFQLEPNRQASGNNSIDWTFHMQLSQVTNVTAIVIVAPQNVVTIDALDTHKDVTILSNYAMM